MRDKRVMTSSLNEVNKLKNQITELREKLDEKDNELILESALERISTVAMAMRKPEDLLQICKSLYNELTKLGFRELRNAMVNVYDDHNASIMNYDFSEDSGPTKTYFKNNSHPVIENFIKEIRKARDAFYPFSLKGKKLSDFIKFRKSNGEKIDSKLKNAKAIYYYFYSIGNGSIGISTLQPISKSNTLILKRFRNVFEIAYQRYTDISLAQAQAREAQIEAALERVRAASMAMHKSDELKEAAAALYKELRSLNIGDLFNCGYVFIDEKNKQQQAWMTNSDGSIRDEHIMPLTGDEVLNERYHNWKKKLRLFSQKVGGDKLKKHHAFVLRKANQTPRKNKGLTQLPDPIIFYCGNFPNGYLHILSREELSKESESILSRFTKVFEQTYTRFLDLQKAEALAREAQIQLALERVRARTMAMQSSNELAEVSFLLNKQVVELGIPTRGCAFNVYNEHDSTEWFSNLEGTLPTYKTPREKIFLKYYEAGQRGESLLIEEFSGKKIKDHYNYLFKTGLFGNISKEKLKEITPALQIDHVAYFKYGYLLFITLVPTPQAHEIFKRFAKEFEQTYTRFLDLQKSEAQAREAQIQLALERVRARTMAMQNSNELPTAANLLFQQVQQLGMPAWSAGYCIWDEDKQGITLWMSSEGVMQPSFHAPLTEDPSFIHMREAFERSEDFHVEEVGGKELEKHYKYMRTLPVVGKVLDSIIDAGHPLPVFQIFHCVYFSKGFLLFITYEPVPEAHDVFKRFGRVFDQTYTRFLDLQKSEAQAKEAQIQLALERVRARTMAMQKSEELAAVSEVLRKEMGLLGVEELETSSIYIMNKNETTECWYALKDVHGDNKKLVTDHMTLRLNETWVGRQMKKFYYSKEARTSIVMMGENRKEWINHCAEKSSNLKGYYGDKIPERTYHLLKFSNGFMGAASLGEISQDSWDLLQRTTAVFSFAYKRFSDLQKAEAQAREAQIEVALERVRSKTMAMHNSKDVGESVAALFDELITLGLLGIADRCGIGIMQPNEMMELWTAERSIEKTALTIGHLNMQLHPLLKNVYQSWLNKKETYRYVLQGEDKYQYHEAMLHQPNYKIKKDYYSAHEKIVHSDFFFKEGCLYVFSLKELTAEANSIFTRFTNVFGQTYRRYLDLQKAEAQAREAQIEAALERVRSRSMAMHNSNELLEASGILFSEMQKLGIESLTAGFVLMDKEEKNGLNYTPDPSTKKILPLPIIIPHNETIQMQRIVEHWKKGSAFFVIEMDEEETIKHQTFIAERSTNFSLNAEQLIAISPKKLFLHNFYFKEGYLLIVGGVKLIAEQVDIMLRFAKVFQQTYTRFLDLQKAESQAREAQIESALERIRNRTTGMQQSSELAQTVSMLFKQLVHLGIDQSKIRTCGVATFFDDEPKAELWMSDTDGEIIPKSFEVPFSEAPAYKEIYTAWKKGEKFLVLHLKGEAYLEHLGYVLKYTNVHNIDLESLRKQYSEIFFHVIYFSQGYLYLISYEPVPDYHDILKRLGTVFQQSYTRFLDLQRAEAQAREAQIEAALERVRAQAMAMHNSDDMGHCILKMFSELTSLGVDEGTRFGIGILNHGNEINQLWTARKNGDEVNMHIGSIDMVLHPLLKSARQAWLDQIPFHKYVLEGEDLLNYYQILNNAPDYKIQIPLAQLPEKEIQHCFIFEHGFFYAFSSREFEPELIHITKRFTSQFGQTYRRYLDLVRAEAQAREAQIEAALEKVRSRTMAMQHSDELSDAAFILFQQLNRLGVVHERINVGIVNVQAEEIDFWVTEQGGNQIKTRFKGSIHEPTTISKVYQAWKADVKSLVIDLSGDELASWLKYLTEEIKIPFNQDYKRDRRVQTCGFFSKGVLVVTTPEPLGEEALYLLEKFAGVFDLTYTRFNDLKVAEANALRAEQDLIAIKEAKQKAESALADLQATQKQLVQSEKMASLGELTAGIAHEIQNPLNFVNNFSEVSTELVAEMNAEIEKGNLEDAKEISNDLKQNLEKINHHGKRAADIVKGMLQHSRSSSGVKELTNINTLADEYLRLAYHGLRAKDKSFNATIKTEFDQSIENVNVVPQDIGRVILNLITNAFYVVNEKSKQHATGYEPTVTVSTRSVNGKIIVSVKDNGNGIPLHIKEKIFQPFFTTKPTGQGTGLGLSLSYDIVKAHGGELTVETKEGEGSEFNIVLQA